MPVQPQLDGTLPTPPALDYLSWCDLVRPAFVTAAQTGRRFTTYELIGTVARGIHGRWRPGAVTGRDRPVRNLPPAGRHGRRVRAGRHLRRGDCGRRLPGRGPIHLLAAAAIRVRGGGAPARPIRLTPFLRIEKRSS